VRWWWGKPHTLNWGFRAAGGPSREYNMPTAWEMKVLKKKIKNRGSGKGDGRQEKGGGKSKKIQIKVNRTQGKKLFHHCGGGERFRKLVAS